MIFTAGQKRAVALLLVVAVCVAGYFYYRNSKENEKLTLYGNVDVRQVSLAFNASERIDEMFVDEGASVKKGQLLATLKTDTLKLNIAQCKAQIETQEAVVERLHNGSRPEEIVQTGARQREAEADYEYAVLYQKRMAGLYEQSAISKQTLDDADAKLKAARGALDDARAENELAVIGPRIEEIKEAEALLKTYKAELQIHEYNLTQANLIAPADGTIRSRLQEPGDMTTSSKAVFLMTVNTRKWVRAYVSESQLGLVKPGMEAKVTIDSFPDKPIAGEIGYISDVAEFTPKTVQTTELRTSLLYEVRVYVDDPDNVLRMGMPATVTFD